MNKRCYLIVNIIILVFVAITTIIHVISLRKMKAKLKCINKREMILNEMQYLITTTKDKKELYEVILSTVINVLSKGDKAWLLVKNNKANYHCESSVGSNTNINDEIQLLDELNSNNFKELNDKILLQFNNKSDESQIILPIIWNKNPSVILIVKTLKSSKKFNNKDVKMLYEIRSELELAIRNITINESLIHIATHDYLTDLYNRRYFTEIFMKEVDSIYKDKSENYLVLIDIDNFKDINDLYGHKEGDMAIKSMSNAMRLILGDNHIYARLAGDEFVILFKNQTYIEVEQKIFDIKNYLDSLNGNVKLDFSYGIAKIHTNNMNKEELFRIADEAMYKNKKNKKLKNN